ncbi:MAG: prolyl oligopeptidase family serine peptidase [Bryobacteraceae bacterium]
MTRTTALLCILIASGWTAELAANKRPFTADDYYAIETPGDPQISPDSTLVAYTVTAIDRKQNRKQTGIWMAKIDGSGTAWAFATAESSTSPRWSPDGRTLAFISTRRNLQAAAPPKAQVYALSMSGGDPRRLSDLKNGVTAFQWSPDGTQLACVSKTGPSDSLPAGKERSDVREYANAQYKLDGVGYFDDRRSHIWVVDVKTGSAKQISSGGERNDSDPQWSPDGRSIAFVGQRTDSDLLGGVTVYIVPAEGGAARKLSNIHVGSRSVRWSPDGRRVAFVGSVDAVAIPKMWIAPANGGTATVVSNDVTYATDLAWSEDGRALFYAGAFKGEHPVFRIDLASRQVTPLSSRMQVRQIDVAKNTLVYTASDDTHPGDVFAAELSGAGGGTGGGAGGGAHARRLTHLNAKLLSEVAVQPMERLNYRAADGWDIEGFLTKPLGWQAGKSYPMILMIHGGPNGMWGLGWNHEIQAFASHGWAVLGLNPRGSSGYGETFQRGVDKEWGGKAFEDIMSGVDAALAKYTWIDRNRLGVTGHSYGGFMTDWIAGHTNRFKAAIALAGISNLISVEGTRDAFYGHSRDFGGDVFDNFDLYWKYSPVRYAKDVKTPTLLLHGEADQRVPLEEGEQFFRALRHFGVPAELVIFPREGHGLRNEPKHAVELLKWQMYWFDRWVDGNANAVKPNVVGQAFNLPGAGI